MRHLLLAATILAATLLAAAPASAQQFEAGVDIGTSIPVSAALTDIAGPGIHVGVSFYYEVIKSLSVGAQISYDSPFGKTINGLDTETQWTSANARVRYSNSGFFRYWAAVGVGFYWGTLSACSATTCAKTKEKHFGIDAEAGVAWEIMRGFALGPALGIRTPDVAQIGDELLVTASLMGMFNF